MENLNNKGYFIIKNCFDKQFIDDTKNKITTDNVQTDMLEFVKVMMNQIGNRLGTEIDFLKFRVSNNNNSVDAGGFHRDVVCLKKWYPVITCLTYLDDTVMEIIEYSHKCRNLRYIDSTKLFNNNKKRITLKSGDIMIFYSTLLHRGVFTNTKSPNRRLVQVFDCFEKGHDFYHDLISVLGKERNNDLMIKLNKINFTSYIFSMYSYYNFISGTSKKDDKYFANKIGYSMISSEGLVKRWTYEPFNGQPQPLNVYILNPEMKDKNNILSDEFTDEWRWIFYERQAVYYTIYILILLILLIFLIVYLFLKK